MSIWQNTWFRNTSSRGVMLGGVLFSVLLIGIMWGAVFTLLKVDRENTIRAAVERNDTLAIALVEYAVRTIESADRVVQSLIREYKRSGGKVNLTRFAVDNAINSDAVSSIVLVDEHGNAQAINLPGSAVQPVNVADREYFRIHLEHDSGKLFIGKPITGRLTDIEQIPFARRINKADGTFGGMAIAFVPPERFTNILQGATLRPFDTISLLGLDGITRARLVQSKSSSGQDVSISPLYTEQAKHPVGNLFARGVIDGVLKYFSYRTIPNYPLMAIVGTPKDDVLAQYYQRQKMILWAAGLSSVAIVGFTLLLLAVLKAQRRAFTTVAYSEARNRGLLTVTSDGICFLCDGEIQYVNDALVQMLGYQRPDELIGRQIYELMHPDMRESLRKSLAKVKATFSTEPHVEAVMLHQDGSSIEVEFSVAPYMLDGVLWKILIIRDITKRKRVEVRIVQLNRVYAVLSGINTLIVRAKDRDELFREACRVVIDAGGFLMAMLIIINPDTKKLHLVASAGKDEFLSNIKDRLSTSDAASKTMVGIAIREKQPVVANDSINDPRVLFGKRYAESGIRSMVVLPLIVADDAIGALALYAGEIEFFHEDEMMLLKELAGDISFAIDHLDKQEKLNYLAYNDELTGLANRTLFFERVSQYIRSAEIGGHKLGVLIIDMERFKNVNDSLGRSVGDLLLKQVAEWLSNNMGGKKLMARLDADHFAVVMPEIRSEGELPILLNHLSEAFAGHTFQLNGNHKLRVGAKAGVAIYPDDGSDVDTLFRNAEAALKIAKKSGDRYLFHTKKMTEAVSAKLILENQLRQAIDNREFELYYQPKVNLVSGKVTGAEALISWNDPHTGQVPPGKFIPILEETGLIYEVGRWALRQAMSDYLRWHKAGLAAVRIAVNVSPLQLRSQDFVAEIRKEVGIGAHAAEGLELEISEGMIMEDLKHSTDTLQAIRALGVTIAIDDFGTGFSSLGNLAKLPVDTLKIDRSFVIEMNSGSEGMALVSTIISLAHALKLKVVAEGVETKEQSKLLRLLSCDEMQGYLFSKPVSCEEFEMKFLSPRSIEK
jgi:diguanylate cyclase (GGDEF)-like protein/PAS domain S-box-containing protein